MRHNEKSENIAQGRRSLVIASQAVGVVAVYGRHRRPKPFVSGQIYPKSNFFQHFLEYSA